MEQQQPQQYSGKYQNTGIKPSGGSNPASFSTTTRFFDHKASSTSRMLQVRPKGQSSNLTNSQLSLGLKSLNLASLQTQQPQQQQSQQQKQPAYGSQTARDYTSSRNPEPYVQLSPFRANGKYIQKSSSNSNNHNNLNTQTNQQFQFNEQSQQNPQQQQLLIQIPQNTERQNINQTTITTTNNGSVFNSSNQNNNTNMNVMSLSFTCNTEEISQLKAVLGNLIQKEEEVFKSLTTRANKLNDIVSQLSNNSDWQQLQGSKESDLSKLGDAVHELSESLSTAAKTEIELGTSCREIERLILENRHLTKKHNTQLEKNLELQKIIDLQQQRIKTLQEENNKYMILLNSEKKENRFNTKKVSALEKRVEFILENEVNVMLNPNDKLRQSLNELLRENESLKRDLTHKNQEIERNLGNNKRMADIVTRLNAKIDSLKKEPLLLLKHASDQNTVAQMNPSSNMQIEAKPNKETSEFLLASNAKLKKNDDIDLFSNFVIPPNLEFRVVSLKADHQNLIADLIEGGNKFMNYGKTTGQLVGLSVKNESKSFFSKIYFEGSMNFTKQIMNSNSQIIQRDAFNLIASQLLSFKELSEKVNLMISGIHSFFRDAEWKDSIPDFNLSLAKIFNAYSAHVWVVDSSSGVLITYENSREKKCLLKGLIGESFFTGKSINSKNARNKPLLFLLTKEKEESVTVDTCLIIPIKEAHTNQVKMIVEMSNSKNELFSFDEEYLSIILAHYLSLMITHRYTTKMQESALKFNSQLLEEFDYLMYATSRQNLSHRVKTAFHRCFGISAMLFYFIEDGQLVRYDRNSEDKGTEIRQCFSLHHGLVGQAVLDQKSYIITDIKQSSYYNKLVDLQSILPVFAIPLIDQAQEITDSAPHKQVFAVLEIALKQKYRSTQTDMLIDGFTGYFGLEESLSSKVQQFSQIIIHAIKHAARSINLPAAQQA